MRPTLPLSASILPAMVFLAFGGRTLVAQPRVVTYTVSATVRSFARWELRPAANGEAPRIALFTNDRRLRSVVDTTRILTPPGPVGTSMLPACEALSLCPRRDEEEIVLLTVATP